MIDRNTAAKLFDAQKDTLAGVFDVQKDTVGKLVEFSKNVVNEPDGDGINCKCGITYSSDYEKWPSCNTAKPISIWWL